MLHLKKQAAAAPGQLAVYIHWPFCLKKCPYCDFNSHVREKISHDDWTAAYLRELRHTYERTGPREVVSVFFGGGTPSLMEPSTVGAVLNEIDTLWGLPQGAEVTLEANPTSIEANKLRGFRAAGVGRVSLGVQALNDADLKQLGRGHSAAEAIAAVETAASVFDRFSFDLIYARSGQTPEQWQAELRQALEMSGGHLSLYQLTIEEGTQFHTLHARGELVVPGEDAAATLYEITQEMTRAAGMPAYEVSNHARFGDESRHNLVYWRYGDYAGIGPGAHGRLTLEGVKHATRMHRAPEIWLEKVARDGHGTQEDETIDFPKRGREMLMMGLRLGEGVDLSRFKVETGMEFSGFVNPDRVKMLEGEGFLVVEGGRLHATAAGRQRLNAVLSYLLAA